MDITALVEQCAPTVQPETMLAIISVESNHNPYAVGVVNGHLERQPQSETEAIVTVQSLAANDWNYSVGLMQINRTNFERFGLTNATAFNPCTNLRVGSQILTECFVSHADVAKAPQIALRDAFSCYYSGNYHRGHVIETSLTSYVDRVLSAFTQLSIDKINSH